MYYVDILMIGRFARDQVFVNGRGYGLGGRGIPWRHPPEKTQEQRIQLRRIP
jgi:hypothetical protein